MIETQVVRNVLSLVHRHARIAHVGPFIDAHGRVQTNRDPPSCPYDIIVKCVYLYNACCRMIPCFAEQYAELYDEFVSKSSPHNMMCMRMHDVGLGVRQLRELQQNAAQRVREHPAMRKHEKVGVVMSSPCSLTVEVASLERCQIGIGESRFVVTACRMDAARDWPTIPPGLDVPSPEPVTVRASPAWVARLLLLRELMMFEPAMWTLSRDAETRAVLAGGGDPGSKVHLMHMALEAGTISWNALHADIKGALVDRLRMLVETLS
jgi:hypothetical protein